MTLLIFLLYFKNRIVNIVLATDHISLEPIENPATDHISLKPMNLYHYISLEPIKNPLNRSYLAGTDQKSAQPIISRWNRSKIRSTDHISLEPIENPGNRSYLAGTDQKSTQPIIDNGRYYLNQSFSYLMGIS